MTGSVDQSLFDKEEFKRWLEGKPDDAVVGYATNPGLCPIANWIEGKGLCADIHSDRAEILDVSVAMLPEEYSILLPWWAQCFIYDVDTGSERKRQQGTLSYKQVSKQEALEALTSCLKS